ncbi:MAG: sugar phosphate isomerase/epimerase [Opitutus sp.]|nr:sugar phosphate isomerase/epimerase [Opitutus sp.]
MPYAPLPPLVLSGLADEAADDLPGQMAVHRELGWSALELRLIGGQQTSGEFPAADFARAADALDAAGLRVTALASAIGNWSRPITGDFARDFDELRAAIPRLQRVGARFIRGMSWVGAGVAPEVWRDEAVRRYRELGALAADAGIVLLHENCEGWGGLSPAHACEFHERVAHPGVGVLFDTGNVVAYGLDAWEFYSAVKPFIQHVHIKDAKRNPAGGKSSVFTLPGEGDAAVRRILVDLLRAGYRGAISIEPHVASIVHTGGAQASPAVRRDSYLRYGRVFSTMVAEIRRELAI